METTEIKTPAPFSLKETGLNELTSLCMTQPYHTIYLTEIVFLGKDRGRNEEHFRGYNPLAPINPEEGPDYDLLGWKDNDGSIVEVLGVSSIRFKDGELMLNGVNFTNPDWDRLSIPDANRVYTAAYKTVHTPKLPF